MGKKNSKQKKEKPIYIDDGSTISDMSGLQKGKSDTPKGAPPPRRPHAEKRKKQAWQPSHLGGRGTLRDQARTYMSTVRMMFIPMLVTLGIITLAFLIMWLLLHLAG